MDWPFKAFTLTLITLSLLAVTSANCGFDGCEPTFSNVTYQNFNENYSNLFDNNHNLFFELNSPFKNNMEYKTFEVKAYAPLKKTSSKIDLLESRYVPVTTVDTSSEDNTDTSSEDNTDTSSEDNVYLPSKITTSPKTTLYIIKTTPEPVVEEPVVEEPVVEEPVVEEPVVEEPVVYKNAQIEQYIFEYTNMERSSYGLEALVLDSALSQISQDHSDDMAENDYFSHINLDGETPTDRAIAADYNVVKYLGDGYYSTGIGENIAKMPTGNVIGIGYVSDDAESIAKAIVDAWMDSDGHRANILNSQYTNMGIGVAFDGTYYIATQNFY
ncbi:hypothetical protein GYY_08025 [Methanococcus maripaludis X1]|uniref:SCP domain-containing protein n=1 Tax=Methanococcus maripaludis X1 TaxID=1053692 RepID=G0H2I4_METMI|nr:CAP domain-containing protein [Methanococcus maripaludis]AEK20459.1 hypothetical protein GYY_08025 [Methanococcus maripaludis X1]